MDVENQDSIGKKHILDLLANMCSQWEIHEAWGID